MLSQRGKYPTSRPTAAGSSGSVRQQRWSCCSPARRRAAAAWKHKNTKRKKKKRWKQQQQKKTTLNWSRFPLVCFIKCFSEADSRGRPQEEHPDGPPLLVRVLGTSLRPEGTQGGVTDGPPTPPPPPPYTYPHAPTMEGVHRVGVTQQNERQLLRFVSFF